MIQHYRDIGLLHGWDRERAIRLCQWLNITPTELGRLCCVFKSPRFGELPDGAFMTYCLRENHFPPYVAISFALLESWFRDRYASYRSAIIPNQAPVIPLNLILKPTEEIPRHD